MFVAQPVKGPVALDKIAPEEPFVPAGVPEQAGPVAVNKDAAATLWLDPLDVIRVHHDAGAVLRFARIVGTSGTRARVYEPGAPIDATSTYLVQPPGHGDVWMIWSDTAATVRVERPVARDGRLVWDRVHRDLVAWVDGNAARPTIPVADGAYDAAVALDADALVGAAIEAEAPALKKAVRAWRKAGVAAALTAMRPLVEPQLAVTRYDDLPGMGDEVTVPDPASPGPRPYHRVKGPVKYQLPIEGPGVLRVEVRAMLPTLELASSQAEPPTVTVGIATAGRPLGKRTITAEYAMAPDLTTPPPAFPPKLPLRSDEGDYLGDRVVVSIPTFPGKHTYTVEIDGGAIAVRVASAHRRVRVGEALGGRAEVDRFLSEAASAVGSATMPAAELVRRLIAERMNTSVAATPAPKLPPLLQLAWAAAAGKLDGKATFDAARTAPPGVALWRLVLELALRLPNPDDVRELYKAARGAPPPSVIADLAALLPHATPIERVRNWQLAAIDVAYRASPLDPRTVSALHEQWRAGEWALIQPLLADPDAEPPQPHRWLVETLITPTTQPRTWKPGDLARIRRDKPMNVAAVPSPLDSTRAALLDVFVATAASDPGPIGVEIDGHKFSALALAPVEQLQLAVAPGAHKVAISGPASLAGWISQMPAGPVALADTARVHHYWPAETDDHKRLSYLLPPGDLPIPVEIGVRVSGQANGKSVHVTVHNDSGKAVELDIVPGGVDPRAHQIDPARGTLGDAEARGEASFVVRLPPHTQNVWFETSDPQHVFASIASRREMAPKPSSTAPRPVPGNDLVDRVAAASKTLVGDPDDPRARASRVSDLLDLGEVGLAREDLVRLLAVPASRRASLGELEEELFARLDDLAEPTHVALADGLPKQPLAVAPALLLAADAPLANWKAAAVAVRERKPDEALRATATAAARDPIAAAIAARAYAAKGDDEASAVTLFRAYQRDDRWQTGFEAVDTIGRVLSDHKRKTETGVISLAYGAAQRVRLAIDHPRLRRVLVVAAAQSGWDTITATTNNAGQEHLLTTEPILPPAPSVIIREALLAPPWPVKSAHTLTPGNAAVLDLTFPAAANLRAEVFCIRVRTPAPPAKPSDAPCSFTARIDNGMQRPFTAARDKVAGLMIEVPANRHVVEVGLAQESEGDAASVRFVSDKALGPLTGPAEGSKFPIRIERRMKVFVASATAPITATVAGPGSLWVQGRVIDPSARSGKSLEIIATPPKGDPIKMSVPLLAEPDNEARGDQREVNVSAASDTFLLLPDAGPYQITVRPDRGEIVGRMALRDERRGKIPRLPGPWYAAAPPQKNAFALPEPPGIASINAKVLAEPAAGGGTLSLELSASQDPRSEEDIVTGTVLARAETALMYRRALVPERWWIDARGFVRDREQTALIAGGDAELYGQQLALGTTLHLSATAATQSYSDGRAVHARGDIKLSRPFDVTENLRIIPGIGVGASYLNTTPEIVAAANEEIDPEVFNGYRYLHQREGRGALTISWLPYQDFLTTLSATGVSNQNFASVDHIAFAIEPRILLPLPLFGETQLRFAYQPSYWFTDADRMIGYWRHDFSTRLEFTLWTGTQGRFVLALTNDRIYATDYSRDAYGASLRFDITRHRGLADFHPQDAFFPSLVERRWFAPLEPL